MLIDLVALVVGMLVAALPLFAGYALIVFDSRRRGLQDRLARTAVVDARNCQSARRRAERRDVHESGPRAVRE